MEPMNMPYELLRKITDDFSKERIIGSGSFGVVYKGVDEQRKYIAVKVLLNKIRLDDTEFKNEFGNLARLKHRNIVRLLGHCNESVRQIADYEGRTVVAEKIHTALCFEYVNNGCLSKYISDQNQGLNWHIRYKIIKGICEGLKYLREGLESPVWHLDLKPENILLDNEMVPKIADFGLSRLIGDKRTRETLNSVGTRGYLPPEYVRFQLLSEAFDIFSLGVIITKIMIGTEGYHRVADMPPRKLVNHVCNNWRKQLQEILRPRSLELHCKQVKVCIEIASKCLKENRHERPSIQEIVYSLAETEADIRVHSLPLKTEQSALLLWWRRLRRGKKVQHDDVGAQQVLLPPRPVEQISLDDIYVATDGFCDYRRIGTGSFGSMYRGTLPDGREVAIKRAENLAMLSSSAARSARRRDHEMAFNSELSALAHANHKNIVCLLGCCTDSGERVLAFEFMRNGTLHDHLHSGNPLAEQLASWRGRLTIALGAARALEYMHIYAVPSVTHRDIKSANILLDESWTAKISDFGLSTVLNKGSITDVQEPACKGTVGYMDPEYYKLQHLTDKSDVYSFGVVLLELVSGCRVVQRYADSVTPKTVVEFTVPHILADNVMQVTDRRLPAPTPDEARALAYVGYLAADCVGPVGCNRPSMTEVAGVLERALEACTAVLPSRAGASVTEAVEDLERQFAACPIDLSRRIGSSLVQNFTLDALNEATDRFSDKRRLGSGSFGTVYHGTLPDGRQVAIKRADGREVPWPSRRRGREAASELTALARANHKNIVCLLGCCDESGERVLVYEYMANGTLHDNLHSRVPMAPAVSSWRGRLAIALDAARGIEYMHVYAVPPIIHRDVKSANILLDDAWTAKIADFGLSSVLDPSTARDTGGGGNQQEPPPVAYTGGTVGYMDPEYYRLQHLTDKSDVYSFGVVLLELVSGCRVVQRYAESVTPKNVVEFAVPHILADEVSRVLDPRLPAPAPDEAEALAYVGYLAADCVGPVGCDRPCMTEVVDALERALAACGAPPISRAGTGRRPALSRSGTDQFDLTDTD